MTIPPRLSSFTEKHPRFFKFKECLAVADQSPRESQIVRAHIIPRSKLKQNCQDGHVVAVPTSLLAIMKMQRAGFEAKEIGVGEFSTMNCFCAGHDKAIFSPVEAAPLVFSPEQLALFHYRAEAYQSRHPEGPLLEPEGTTLASRWRLPIALRCSSLSLALSRIVVQSHFGDLEGRVRSPILLVV